MSKEFYAVFIESSIHIPGDERSRQCPGHGYPAHDQKYTEVIKFDTEELLKEWIQREEGKSHKKKYEVVVYRHVFPKVRIEIDL